MRKIASNYVDLPGFGSLEHVYAEIEGNRLFRLMPFQDGGIKEMEGLEFYAGILVEGDFSRILTDHVGHDITSVIEEAYKDGDTGFRRGDGFYIISGIDWEKKEITGRSRCVKV